MKIEFSPLANTAHKKICKLVADALCIELGQAAKMQADINFVSSAEIAALNKNFRSANSATDCLSFPFVNLGMGEKVDNTKHGFQRDPVSKLILLGEIYLNTEKIEKQATEYGHGFDRELAYITAHSLLHLFGYGHDNAEDEKAMNELCEKITAKAGYIK